MKDPDEQLEYCLRPYGLMRRNVRLEEGWYRDAYGPMLAFRKEDGMPVALLPKAFLGYSCIDPVTEQKTSLNRQSAAQFDADAICFYRPIPLKKLGIPDLIVYLKSCLSVGDFVVLLGLTLLTVLLGNVFSSGLSSLLSLLYITQIFHYAPALVLPALAIILTSLAFSVISSLTQIRIIKQVIERGAKENGMSFALISGVQKIKLAGAEKRAFARWARAYSDAAELTYNPPVFIKANVAITTAISLAGTILIYFLAVKTCVSSSEYIAFNTAFGMVTGAFASLTGVALSVAQIKPILEMSEPILKTEPESAENKSVVTSLTGGIELSNVCFRYNENMPYVVDGMSLKIRPGEYVAIVGTTGCGKSTLMRLLLGSETPEKGASINGKDMVLPLGGSGAGKTIFLNAICGYEKANASVLLGGVDIYKHYKKYRVGYAPQQDTMRGKDTINGTLMDAAKLRLPKDALPSERKARVDKVLDIFGLTPSRTPSGGKALRRVAEACVHRDGAAQQSLPVHSRRAGLRSGRRDGPGAHGAASRGRGSGQARDRDHAHAVPCDRPV